MVLKALGTYLHLRTKYFFFVKDGKNLVVLHFILFFNKSVVFNLFLLAYTLYHQLKKRKLTYHLVRWKAILGILLEILL